MPDGTIYERVLRITYPRLLTHIVRQESFGILRIRDHKKRGAAWSALAPSSSPLLWQDRNSLTPPAAAAIVSSAKAALWKVPAAGICSFPRSFHSTTLRVADLKKLGNRSLRQLGSRQIRQRRQATPQAGGEGGPVSREIVSIWKRAREIFGSARVRLSSQKAIGEGEELTTSR